MPVTPSRRRRSIICVDRPSPRSARPPEPAIFAQGPPKLPTRLSVLDDPRRGSYIEKTRARCLFGRPCGAGGVSCAGERGKLMGMPKTIGRFEILEEVGRGSMG